MAATSLLGRRGRTGTFSVPLRRATEEERTRCAIAALVVTCQDGRTGMWDYAGKPQPGSSPDFDVELMSYPALLSWDGQVLVLFPTTGSAAASP